MGKKRRHIGDRFEALSETITRWTGSTAAFASAIGVIVVWAVVGPLFRYSDTWQLVINTGTTVVTFLMVFMIQSTQNRDAKAIHLKLDELIRSSKARDVFADLEDATEDELVAFKEEFKRLRQRGLQSGDAAEAAHEATHKPGSH
jgi:low affinity Fe/Cu permease